MEALQERHFAATDFGSLIETVFLFLVDHHVEDVTGFMVMVRDDNTYVATLHYRKGVMAP